MKTTLIVLLLTLSLTACQNGTETPPPAPVDGKDPLAETQADGKCVLTPPAQAVACTMDWRPVCGCDGVTYSNPCSARAAGVPKFSEGECGGKNLD